MSAPTCPKCGRPMRLMTARRGRNAGSKFWSCTGYSSGQCNGTLDYSESPDVATDTPSCPKCGRPMRLMTARRGRNAGSKFWSCTGYPSGECNGTLNYSDYTAAGTPSQPQQVEAPPIPEELNFKPPATIVTQPFHTGLDTVYYQFVTVAASEIDDYNEALDPDNPPLGSQWRLSYQRKIPPALDNSTQRVLALVDKMILKGHVSLLSEELEQTLNRAPTPVSNGPYSRGPLPSLDSEEEKIFWQNFLPAHLGESFSEWVTPQIEIATLATGAEFEGTEQRVDFLVCHPLLSQPVVIEIDGEQHREQANYDAVRTQHLEQNGYAVLRIPAVEVREGTGDILDEVADLFETLQEQSDRPASLSSPIRRAGQLQVALLQAMYLGDIPVKGGVVLSTDLVDAGELTLSEFNAIVEDFQTLLSRVAQLYGTTILVDGLRATDDSKAADCRISFYEFSDPTPTIMIEEVCLPLQIKWQPRPTTIALPTDLSPDLLRFFLKRIFRKDDFRDGQFDIVTRALAAKDTVALLPTGAGKSIAFQLAAMLLPGRTIVIAPIISLIRDQIYNLSSYGIDRALGITGEMGGRAARSIAYQLLQDGEAFLYYIAPERMQMEEFRNNLRGMTTSYPVNLIVVDEAHCVSEWGHDFRTSYLRIGETSRECARSSNWTPALIALTGTASRAVLRDLQRELQIEDFDAIVTPSSFDRKELEFAIIHERSDQKQHVLEAYLKNKLPTEFGLPPEAFFRKDGNGTFCGLVFCPHANGSFGVTEISSQLNRAGINSKFYSGQRPKNFSGSNEAWNTYKREIEQLYKRDRVSVLVTTKAFGMGIDKQNIRFTVHYGIPASIEAFYQEAGRAGRNGERAICTAIVSDDRAEDNRLLLAPATPIEDVSRIMGEIPYAENDDISRSLFFHVRSFRGVQYEMNVVQDVLNTLSPTGKKANRVVPFGDDRTLTEKALHRLVVTGVVADYTVDYSAHEFTVYLASVNRSGVISKYTSYVAGYQSGRAEQERKKAESLPEEWNSFVLGVVRLYVQFVYDVIERGQRRGIAEMLAACQSGNGEELRRRILSYLDQSEFSEAVESILTDAASGLGKIRDVLAEIISPNDANRLRGPVSRALETYPDHPGLLLLRTATEALCRDGDILTTLENYEGFLKNAKEAYGLSEEEITVATGTVLHTIMKRNKEAAQRIESAFVQEHRSRNALRRLVKEVDMTGSLVSPWILLQDLTNEVKTTLLNA